MNKKLLSTILLLTTILLFPSSSFAMMRIPGVGGKGAVGTVATPTDSPGAGTYSSTQTVTLSDATGSSTICYTTDGSTPAATTPGTCSTGTTYSTGFAVASTTTVKAIGTKVAMTNSGVLTSVYTITAPAFVNTASNLSGNGGIVGADSYASTAINTTAGDLLAVWWTYSSGSSSCPAVIASVTSTANGSPSGDTFVQIGSAVSGPSTGIYSCTAAFYASNIHAATTGSGGYVVTLTEDVGYAGTLITLEQFSGVTTLDKTCSGNSATGTLACSGSMTPTASPAVVVGGMGGYYFANVPSNGSGYTLPSGATHNSGSNAPGATSSEYQICTSGCTGNTYTPSFSLVTGTMYNEIIGAIFK
jgi:hypothetical protein